MAMGAGGTVVRGQARRRWAVVLAAVVLLCSIPVALRLWPARAAGVDPATLRERIAASTRQPYEGFAQSNGLLPLPPLPNLEQVTALVSGPTQIRTWYAGPQQWRVDVLGPGTERDLYQTARGQYTWDYGENQLTRIVGAQPVRLPRAADVTPPELVRRILSIAAGDRIEALAGKRVAGVEAAGLRLVPVAAATTVAYVDIWADPATGLPVQAEVTARGGVRPVFVTRFLELHLRTPDPATLTPPAAREGMGYSVTNVPDILGVLDRWSFGTALPERLAGYPRRDVLHGASAVGVYGTGLAQIVVLAVPGRFGSSAYDDVEKFGRTLKLSQGSGAVLATGLLTVLVVQSDRTYLAAGLVDPALLEQAATDLAAAS